MQGLSARAHVYPKYQPTYIKQCLKLNIGETYDGFGIFHLTIHIILL